MLLVTPSLPGKAIHILKILEGNQEFASSQLSFAHYSLLLEHCQKLSSVCSWCIRGSFSITYGWGQEIGTAADFTTKMLFDLDPCLQTTILLIQGSCCLFSLLLICVGFITKHSLQISQTRNKLTLLAGHPKVSLPGLSWELVTLHVLRTFPLTQHRSRTNIRKP